MLTLLLISAGLLIALTAIPLVILLLTSLRPQGLMALENGAYTLDNFARLMAQDNLDRLVVNTAAYAFGTIVLGMIFGALWAWITERTDFRFKTLSRVLMLVTMGLPPLIQGFGWTLLLNPSNGYLNHLLRQLPWIETGFGPIDLYTMPALIVISGFMLTPTVYVMLSGIVKNLDYKLEFPAVLAGVKGATILIRIIGPMLLPGLLSIVIYTTMIMIQVFDIPLTIGLTGGIQVLSTRIYLLSTAELGKPDYNLAAAFGVVLILLAAALTYFYNRVTRVSERFSIVSGKSYRAYRIALGWRRVPVYAFALIFFVIALAPVLIIIWTSLLRSYRLPSFAALSGLSFQNYVNLWNSSLFHTSLTNTLIVVFAGSLLTIALSLLVSYSTLRNSGWLSRTVETLSFLPIAIPHIVLGLAVLLLYVRTPLYGTIWAIVLAQASVNIVFGTRTITSGLIQINRDLERAAQISGVGAWTIMTRILTPIIRTQTINGWLLIFAHAMRDLAIPLIFMTSQTMVLSSALWLTWGYPNLPSAAALSVVLVGLLAVVVIPLQCYVAKLERRAESE